MHKFKSLSFVLCFIFLFLGCGYSTRSVALGKLKTIYIEPFRNKIAYGAETNRNLYIPLLEIKLTNAVVDRFLFDGNLKVAKKDDTDLILKGELINYERSPLRYTDNNDVQEYRITITASLTLWDNAKGQERWTEPAFSGDTTYFTIGTLAKSENAAIEAALVDIAKRIVERTVEDW